MKPVHIFLITSLLTIVGCASKPPFKPAPDWVDGISKQYPSELYLTGVGSSLNLFDSKNLARADLAKSFEVTVNESSQDMRLFERSTKEGETTSNFDEKVFRTLVTKTSRSIEGIEIVDTYHNHETHQRFALAALSKQKAREQFRQQISKLDDATQQAINKANNEKNYLKKARAAQQAIQYQTERIAQQASLQVVDSSGRGVPAKWNITKLEGDLEDVLDHIYIMPSHSNTAPDEIKEMTSAAITQAGFVVSDMKQADYILKLEADLDKPINERGWVWIRGTLELELVNTNNEVIGVKRWPLKTSSTSEERSKARINDEINKVLQSQLRETILSFGK